MSGITDSLFGSKQKTRQKVQRLPPVFSNLRTGLESRVGLGGTSTRPTVKFELSPELRRLSSDIISNANTLVSSAGDVNNPFVDARTRPLRQARDRRIADINRGFARRGVFGTFRRRALDDVDLGAAQAIGDAETQARFQQLGLGSQLAVQAFNQELAKLGLSQDLINLMVASQQQSGVTSTTRGRQAPIETIGSILAGTGSILAA